MYVGRLLPCAVIDFRKRIENFSALQPLNRVRQRTVRVIFQLSFYYLNWVLPCIVTAATCCRCCAIKFPNIKFNLPPFMTHSFWECFFLLLLLRYSWGSLCGRAKTRLYFMRCRFRNGKWASYATRAGIFRRNKYAIRDSMRMKKIVSKLCHVLPSTFRKNLLNEMFREGSR